MTKLSQVSEMELEEGSVPWIGPHGQCMERLELHLTYTCPERCVFCSEDHRMRSYKKFPVTWGRVVESGSVGVEYDVSDSRMVHQGSKLADPPQEAPAGVLYGPREYKA